MEAPLHQELAPTLADQRHALRRRGMAVSRIDDLEAGDVDAMLRRHAGNLVLRTDQDGTDQASRRGLDRAAERGFVARMDHDRRQCAGVPGARDEAVTRGGTFDHVAFTFSGLVETEARLRERGIDYRSVRVPGTQQVQLFLTDPAGNGVELNFANPSA